MLGIARISIFLSADDEIIGGLRSVLIFFSSRVRAIMDRMLDTHCAIKVAHATPATPQPNIATKT